MLEGYSCSAVLSGTFGFVLYLVAFCTPFWSFTETDTTKAYGGLWFACGGTPDAVTCAETVTVIGIPGITLKKIY